MLWSEIIAQNLFWVLLSAILFLAWWIYTQCKVWNLKHSLSSSLVWRWSLLHSLEKNILNFWDSYIPCRVKSEVGVCQSRVQTMSLFGQVCIRNHAGWNLDCHIFGQTHLSNECSQSEQGVSLHHFRNGYSMLTPRMVTHCVGLNRLRI